MKGGDFSFLLLGAGFNARPAAADVRLAPFETAKYVRFFEAARAAPVGPGGGR